MANQRGGKRKKDIVTDKIYEQIADLIETPVFQHAVQEIRKVHNIVAGETEIYDYKDKRALVIYITISEILKMSDVPPTTHAISMLEKYIFTGVLPITHEENDEDRDFEREKFVDFHGPQKDEQELMKAAFAKIYIYEGASMDEVTEYIERKWDIIQGIIADQRPNQKPKYIRRKDKREKHKKINEVQEILEKGTKNAHDGAKAKKQLALRNIHVAEGTVRSVRQRFKQKKKE